MSKDTKVVEGVSSEVLLERRNSAMERAERCAWKLAFLRFVQRCVEAGERPESVLSGEMHDAKKEEQYTREELARIDREFRRREAAQLELWANLHDSAAA